MLIHSPRHRTDDVDTWIASERVDAIECQMSGFRHRVSESVKTIVEFVAAGPCYAGVSWGKDSVVLAHLVHLYAPDVPLVWVKTQRFNPDCPQVRDVFLSMFPTARYDEVDVPYDVADGPGFKMVAGRYVDRYISGVRADESGPRRVGLKNRGLSTAHTCSPLGWWMGRHIFAYLYDLGLPVHPAYACTQGGLWSRERLRVSSLGAEQGTQFGRAEWENYYYP